MTSLSVSKSVSFTVNGRPASAARLGWGLAMALCLGLTIAYAATARLLSGHPVASFELQRASVLPLPGLTFWRSGSRATRAGPVELAPSMNPVAIVLHVGHTRLSPMERLTCAIVVRDAAKHVVWQDDRMIARGSSGRGGSGGLSTLHICYGWFDVAATGAYTFDVRFANHYGDRVQSATLEVRRDSAGVSPAAIGVGLAAALLCLVAFVRAKRPSADAGTGAQAA